MEKDYPTLTQKCMANETKNRESVEVIVIGGNHQNAFGVLRALGRKGINADFILVSSKKKGSILRSRYINRSWAMEPEKIVDFLKNRENDRGERITIISCHDAVVELLERFHEELTGKYFLPGTESGALLELMNKQTQTAKAEASGLTIPFSIELKGRVPEEVSDIPFPVITKPGKSCEGTKDDIKIFNSPKELEDFLRKNNERSFQVQQFVDTDFEYQLIGASVNGGEEIVIPGVSHILRPYKGSNTEFLHYRNLTADFTSAVEATKRFLRNLKYSGLFSAEFLRGKDGKDYFLEVNFRNDGNTIAVTESGANLPYWWVTKTRGEKAEMPVMKRSVYLMPEHREITLWRKHVITTSEFISDIRKADAFSKYAPDDKRPTFGKTFFYLKIAWGCIQRLFSGFSKKPFIKN